MPRDCEEDRSYCGHDAVGIFLTHMLRNSLTDPIELKPKNEDWQAAGILKTFSQNFYLDESRIYRFSGLAPVGYVYFPYSCREVSCRIHFYFHGC